MKVRSLPILAQRLLAVGAVVCWTVACSSDGGGSDSDAEGSGEVRPGRNDAGNNGTPDAPAPPPPTFTTFDEAWAAYEAGIKGEAAGICPCIGPLFGGEAQCRSEVDSQIGQQLTCVKFAVGRVASRGMGYSECMLVDIARARTCREGLGDAYCQDTDACTFDEAWAADCELLLTAEQVESLRGCDPPEEE